MLIFTNGRCINTFMVHGELLSKFGTVYVYNLTGSIAEIPNLRYLNIDPSFLLNRDMNGSLIFDNDPDTIKYYDMKYYDYLINSELAFSELMRVMDYAVTSNVFICINDYESDGYSSFINESLMKVIRSRYDFRIFIVNEPEDLDYIEYDGSDFLSVAGIQQYDKDKDKWVMDTEVDRLSKGGVPFAVE